MLYAVNDLQVGQSYGTPIIPDFPTQKLDIFVFTNDVILQVTERDNRAFDNPNETEMKLYKGFHSIEPLAPWVAFRFKCLPGIATVTLRAFNSESNQK